MIIGNHYQAVISKRVCDGTRAAKLMKAIATTAYLQATKHKQAILTIQIEQKLTVILEN